MELDFVETKNDKSVYIDTLEGREYVELNAYVIKGEFYPCRCDIFKETYVEKN